MREFSAEQERLLVDRLLRGDKRAEKKFWQLYQAPLKKFISDRVDSPEDVDDLTQETLTAALLCLPRFRFQSRLFTWICGIARHEIADFYRKKG